MRRRPCDVAVQSPCARAVHRRLPALFRRGFPRGGGGGLPADPNLYGLTDLSASNYMATANNGGEPGSASGFGGALLIRLPVLGSTIRVLWERLNGTTGYTLYLTAANVLTLEIKSGAGASASAFQQLNANDVGRILLVSFQHTGTAVRLLVFRDNSPSGDVAITGYSAPSGTPTTLGIRAGGTFPAVGVELFSELMFTGTPALSQMRSLYDATRTLGDFPDAMDGGVVTHAWSLKRELRGTVIVNGQAAPAQLTDTITNAAGDALARVGSPTVKVIDPSVDGRRTLGAMGFSAANYLSSVKGVRGSAGGGWWGSYFRVDSYNGVAGQGRYVHSTLGTDGCALYTYSGVLYFAAINAAGSFINVASYAMTAADYMRPMAVAVEFTGAVWRMFVNGVQAGTDTAGSFRPGTAPMVVGQGLANTTPFDTLGWFGMAGSDTAVPTSAELAQWCTDTLASGRVATITGKTGARYDPTTDILASGGDAVPAQVLDRVGTDHLTRVGPDYLAGNGARGLRLAAASQLATALGGGVQGSPTALTVSFLFSPLALLASTAGGEYLAGKYVSDSVCWYFRRMGGNGTLGSLSCVLNNSSPGAYSLVNGDLNTLMLMSLTYDGTNLRTYVNGTQIGAATAVASFTIPSAAMTVGVRSAGDAVSSMNDNAWFGIGGGAYVATQAELAAQAAASIAAGRLVAIPGKSDDRRYNYDEDAVAQANSLPPRLVNRASGTVDDLIRLGAPLVLAQRTERLFSYETTPIWLGAGGATGAAYSTPNGLAGDPAGFGFVWIGCVDSQAVAANPRIIAAKRGGLVPGYQFLTIGTNSAFQFTVGGASTTATPTTGSIAAGDVGKLMVVACWYDGSKAHMMYKRLELAASGALSGGFVASPAAMTINARSDGFAADGISTRGLVTLLGVPALAELQAFHDAVYAQETIPVVPGRTFNRYDFTKDTQAAGGVLPATVADRSGPDTMTKVGTPVLATAYSRAAA